MGEKDLQLINKTDIFADIRHEDEEIGEYWSARDLQVALGYQSWQNFEKTIEKAKASFSTSKTTKIMT